MMTADASRADVVDWLIDADPSIRWQVLRDLEGAPADAVGAERARVAEVGWGARLLDLQRADGQWGDGVATPFWWTNLYTLVLLRDLGIDPVDRRVRAATERVRTQVSWGPEFLGAYFGATSDTLVERLLGEQLDDGGWNCEAERGSVRSSFHTTICVIEGLLAYEEARGGVAIVARARARAHEYLLERGLLRRRSTGEVIDPTWTRFACPPLWHYDFLRALDYLRAAAVPLDARCDEAVRVVRERRGADGRWSLDLHHADTPHPDLSGPVGEPNRWITLRALRVLDHAREGVPS